MKKIILTFVLMSLIPMSLTISKELKNKLLTEEESVAIVKKEALNEMLDPDSTNFKITYTQPMEIKEEIDEYGNEYSAAIVCGEYNSKNRMGGYNGYQRFYATQNYKGNQINTTLKFEENYKDDKFTFDSFFNILCKK